jgi:hypothetical protein
MEQQVEVWKDIPKYDGVYQVSDLGNVRRVKTCSIGKNLKKNLRYNQRYKVCLCLNGRAISHKICVLVALTFMDYEEKMPNFEIKSKNGNIWDDRLVNLELIPR